MKISKREIAEDQITCTIKLFFEGKNLVSAMTLIHATRVLLEDLDKKRGGNLHFATLISTKITKEQKKEFFTKLNGFPNFCKHSDEDTSDTFESNLQLEESIELLIYHCINLYANLFPINVHPGIFKIYYSYLFTTEKYDFLFINEKYVYPEKYMALKIYQKALRVNKNTPNLKEIYLKEILSLQLKQII